MGEEPNIELLRKVTGACCPSIFGRDLEAGLYVVLDKYGKSNRKKYRVVVYYLLTKEYKKLRCLRLRRKES